MSGNEVTYLSQAAREARGTQLEGDIRKIIRQSFTPADANRNPRFKALMEELAKLRNQYLPSLYGQFDVPMSSDLRSTFGMFGGTTPRNSSAPRAAQPAVSRRDRYVPSAEAQAIIDAVHARKHEDAPEVSEVKHVTGKLAEQRAKAALELIGGSEPERPLRRSDGRGMRTIRTFAKQDGKTEAASDAFRRTAQTAQEERTWKNIVSRGEKPKTPKPVREKKQRAVRPVRETAVKEIVPATADSRPEKKRGPRPQYSAERERIIQMVKERASPAAISEALNMPIPNLNYHLRMLGLNTSGARMKLQLPHNPRIQEILDQLRSMRAPEGSNKVPHGFYTPRLFALVEELKGIYEIHDKAIAGILNCSVKSFAVRKSVIKNS